MHIIMFSCASLCLSFYPLFFRLQGNPICSDANRRNIDQFCGPIAGWHDIPENSTKSTDVCRIQSCPTDNNFEYVPASPLPCFCAAPLRIGYRLKSPSFSYFPPYVYQFEMYLTSSLNLELYQLSIESFVWEKGPRLKMYLTLFPMESSIHSNTFNISEILRIRGRFTSWEFPPSDFFGPYEFLNFTLLGPYSYGKHSAEIFFLAKLKFQESLILKILFVYGL